MADLNLGYLFGDRQIVQFQVKASAAIAAQDFVVLDSNGFASAASAGSNDPIGVAFETVTGTAVDGAVLVSVDISPLSHYRVTVGTGTITQAMTSKTCDLAGAQSIDVTASADDCVQIVEVDTVNNQAVIRLVSSPAGVV